MRNILVATEFSSRCAKAVARAAQLAGATGAGLTLVHVSDDGETGRNALEEAAAASGAGWRLGAGDPSTFILDTARDTSADLIVVGAPKRSSVRDFISGTTAENVIRKSGVPVLMAVADSPKEYQKVLLATDFSEASERAARCLSEIAFAEGAAIHLTNVFDTPAVPLMTRAGSTTSQISIYLLERSRESAAKLADFDTRMQLGAAAHYPKLAKTTAGRIICETAKDTGADLIVVGTQGLTGIRRFVLGSVAEEVLRLSEVDVLAVPAGA